ncbi:MAG TPA: hypothetical protein VFR24_14495, partial [Candidatus Angelobacter sp.]|nr:hypothetical protein [Candidatus Angelobacter sp.]
SFKITPATATATYSSQDPKSGMVPRKAKPGDVVWLKPGKYTVKIEAQGYASDQADLEVKAGASPLELKRNLKSLVADTPATPPTPAPPATSTSVFEETKQWKHEGDWWIWKGSSYAWLHANQGSFDVTIQRPKKGLFRGPKRIEWVIDSTGNDKVVYTIAENNFHRTVYVNGSPVSDRAKDLTNHTGDFHFTFDVSTKHFSITDASGEKIDDYDRPNASTPLGKIGFKGEIAVSIQQK